MGSTQERLISFLTDASEASDIGTLRAAGLSGLAYVRVPDHPDRASLRADFMRLTARHLAVKQAVARLVAAWRSAGVEALVFKGFHLAEWVYASPGERPYHDVDLVVRPEQVDAACTEARSLGWRLTWRFDEPDHARAARSAGYTGHELAQLRHPDLDVTVDVHRRLAHNTHNRIPGAAAQRRLTDAAWTAAEAVAWQGTEIRLLHPCDAVVLGLAVNRGWGSDDWRLKTRDYPDFLALIDRHALTVDALRDRARALGVPRTLDLFLARCDPFRRHLSLVPPTWWQLRAWSLQVARERGWSDLERSAMRAFEGGHDAVELARALPVVWSAARSVGSGAGPAPPAPPGSDAPRNDRPRPLGARSWRAMRRALHRSMVVLGVSEPHRAEVAARAAAALLAGRGHDARLEVDDGAVALWHEGGLLEAHGPMPEER